MVVVVVVVVVMVVSGEAMDVLALAGHKLVRMRVAAASHPRATAELLSTLARDPSRNVRRVVAARPGTPPVALQALAADPDRGTREAVAANTATPSDVLISLLSDSDFAVRWCVVMNPAADLRVRRAMCASPDEDVRFVLAQLLGLPAEIIELLARDPAKQVRESLAESTDDPAVLQALLNDSEPGVRGCAAGNKGTTAAQRRQLVRDPVARVRAAVVHGVAIHGWDIPEEDLLLLARDRSALVRFWVAALPGSTRPVYRILAEDPAEEIATAARAWLMAPDNPTTTPDLPNQVLGGIAVQGHFTNPAQLGRPIPKIRQDDLEQFMNRFRHSS